MWMLYLVSEHKTGNSMTFRYIFSHDTGLSTRYILQSVLKTLLHNYFNILMFQFHYLLHNQQLYRACYTKGKYDVSVCFVYVHDKYSGSCTLWRYPRPVNLFNHRILYIFFAALLKMCGHNTNEASKTSSLSTDWTVMVIVESLIVLRSVLYLNDSSRISHNSSLQTFP